MQVARDMFLTPRRDMKRKMSEVYISLLMEAEFTKEEIFSLYVNKIFLGQRAYGVAAAAEVYFGKTLDQLNIAEMATLAGIPAAPSAVNPVANADAATQRRGHVLGRMRRLGYITQAEYEAAKASPMESRMHGPSIEVDAPVRRRNGAQRSAGQVRRRRLYRRLPGLHHHRLAARSGGHRGAAHRFARIRSAPRLARRDRQSRSVEGRERCRLEAELDQRPAVGGLRPAIVESVEDKSAKIFVKDMGSVDAAMDESCPGRGASCRKRRPIARRCRPRRS
jgi:penicillin-binding protein 1A